jgi:hypothetical protein
LGVSWRNGRFASSIFTTKGQAENWISYHKLSGILTLYPVNQGVYDWALEHGFFEIKKDGQKESRFIQNFTTASQEHYHYVDGRQD